MRRRLVLGLLVAGCARPAAPTAERPYPGVLHPPRELSPDLVVEQHIEATKDGSGDGFDAVVQKRGDELLVVGLGPASVRAFVIRQFGDAIDFEQRLGPKPPFPARNVLVDVHRVFFKRLDGDAPVDGARTGSVDGEEVRETWRGGELVERSFSRPGELSGAVRVRYGPGCRADRCEPRTVRLLNEWFGYALTIDNKRFHWLDGAGP